VFEQLLFHAGTRTAYVYHTVCSGITHRQPAGAVMHDQMNDSLGHMTDCWPAWNKDVKPLFIVYKFV